MRDFSRASWRKSSRSNPGTGGDCVEVAMAGKVGVRDSKNRTGAMLVVGYQEWETLVDQIKTGDLDRNRTWACP
jgi:hypothetical protein